MHSEHTSPDVKVTTSVDTDLNNFSAFLAASHELPKGEPNTYGATPLDRMVTLQQQLELARELQAILPKSLLISISGWGQDEDRRLSREAGFKYHLVKPVEFEDLLRLINL